MRVLTDAELDFVSGGANNSTVLRTAEPIKLVVELIVDILKILGPKQPVNKQPVMAQKY